MNQITSNSAGLAAIVASNVRAEMGRQKLTALALAKAARVNRTTLARRLNGDMAFAIDELECIAEALNVPLGSLLAA